MQAHGQLTLPRYEMHGPPDAPVLVALGGISASRHVAANAHDGSPGWWESVAGAGGASDTSGHRVLGIDFIDGDAGPDGRPLGVVTTHDQADALAAVLDDAGIPQAAVIAGASYGGMVALAFAERHPHRVARLLVMSAAHESDPMTTALRTVQRQVAALGLSTGRAQEGLALARQLAMTTYRSRREFAERFGAPPTIDPDGTPRFPVEDYLRHHGDRFAATWQSARFLALSLSADLHRVDPARVTTPTLLVAAEDDAVVPRPQVDALADAIGGPVRVAEVRSCTGHDAFLTEPAQVGFLLDRALHAPEFP